MAGNKKKIVIVEDSQKISFVLKEVLESENYEVFWANNGIEGIRLIRREKPDLVLLDLLLPKISGYEVCSMVKRDNNLRHIPILVISTLSDPQYMKKAKLCGAEKYMKKPYQLDNLLSEIKKMLGG